MAAQSRVANLELELANLEQRNEQVQLHLHREIADLRELAGASDVKQKMAALEAEKAQLLKKQRALRDERAKAIETFLTQQQFEAKLGAGKKNAKGRKRK